jgi:hypothetical protein
MIPERVQAPGGFIDHWMEDSLINLFTGWLALKCCVALWDNVHFTYWIPQPQRLWGLEHSFSLGGDSTTVELAGGTGASGHE